MFLQPHKRDTHTTPAADAVREDIIYICHTETSEALEEFYQYRSDYADQD